ncbi:MAG: glycosyl transferase family 2 [Rhodoferax sp.]|nr:glycosyl transferase family 2 [Rhodoferax sp.]
MLDFSRPVTVSIVSHRHWSTVQPLLRQLSTWCAASIEKVILTLNVPEPVSIDSDLAFPVEVINNSRPRGFGANHNTAFNQHAAPWFLVMNPDIRVEYDVISALLGRAQGKTALLAPRVLEPGRTDPEPFRTLVTPAELVRRRTHGHLPPPIPSWVAGMFMLFRSDAYRKVRGFDERFFMYCEDVDLCVRLQLQGWKLQVATDLVVLHEAQRDSHTSLRALLWHMSSFLKLWTSDAFWEYLELQKSWSEFSQGPSVVLSGSRHAQSTVAEPDSVHS